MSTPEQSGRPDFLIENLRGMCAYGDYLGNGQCGTSLRLKLYDYCTVCLAAHRLQTAAPPPVVPPARQEEDGTRPDFDQIALAVATRAGRGDILPHIKEQLRLTWQAGFRAGGLQSPAPQTTEQEQMDLEPIKAREARATAGPWQFVVQTKKRLEPDGTVMIGAVAPGHQIRARPPGGSYPSSDGEFIAHARQDIPALIAEIERLRAPLKAQD